jgi:hypothetical protein
MFIGDKFAQLTLGLRVLLVIGGLALRLAPMCREGWELLTSIVCATVFLVGVGGKGRLRSSEVWLRLNTRFLRVFEDLLCGQSGPLWFGELQILQLFEGQLNLVCSSE